MINVIFLLWLCQPMRTSGRITSARRYKIFVSSDEGWSRIFRILNYARTRMYEREKVKVYKKDEGRWGQRKIKERKWPILLWIVDIKSESADLNKCLFESADLNKCLKWIYFAASSFSSWLFLGTLSLMNKWTSTVKTTKFPVSRTQSWDLILGRMIWIPYHYQCICTEILYYTF